MPGEALTSSSSCEINLKIGQYLTKLMCPKQCASFFGPRTCMCSILPELEFCHILSRVVNIWWQAIANGNTKSKANKAKKTTST